MSDEVFVFADWEQFDEPTFVGALRIKRAMDGPFLDNDDRLAAPPMARLRELEHAARQVEEKSDPADPDYLQLSQCRIETFKGPYRTFITQRFDRTPQSRVHFSSAMTQLGYYDGDQDASYLELAEFLVNEGSNTEEDLTQLWRRIVFNIAVSNTDDHLRNHGFIYEQGGWKLSPAYDINPVTPADGLHLFITDNDNRLDYALAIEVIDFFRLKPSAAKNIQDEVLAAVGNWRTEAAALKIDRQEQNRMAGAFNV